MISSTAASWLEELWAELCRRSARPINGVLLGAEEISDVAQKIIRDFLADGGDIEGSLPQTITKLSAPVSAEALSHVATQRTSKANPNLLRDPEKQFWETNPVMPDLVKRGPGGVLTSGEWSIAEPVLWKRAAAVYRRLQIRESDSRDVYAEAVGDFLKARAADEKCPFCETKVFEELPRLFAVVAERRAISWVRKQTTLKMQPNQTGLSLSLIHISEPTRPY